MKYRKPLFFFASLGLAASTFAYGMAVIKFRIPPYSVLRPIWYSINDRDYITNHYEIIKKENRDFHAYQKEKNDKFYNQFKIRIVDLSKNLNDILERSKEHRDLLIERVILPRSIVDVREYKISSSFSYLSAMFYGIFVNGVLKKSSKNNGHNCLVIYNEGHQGYSSKFFYDDDIALRSEENGCDVLLLSMIGMELNEGAVSFPTSAFGLETIFLTVDQAGNHGQYALYYDDEMPEKDPLSLFLSGHYYIIEHLALSYDHISMVGLSGGGWYTTWLAALSDVIDISVSCSGTLPFAFRATGNNHGDWEQVYSQVYRDYDYWSLYQLGTLDKNGTQNRQVVLIYNDEDPCCFMDPEASHFKEIADSMDLSNIRVYVYKSDKHQINPDLVFPFLMEGVEDNNK